MAEKITKSIILKKEIEIAITPQAQMVIAGSKYSIEEFEKWALEDTKISLGGNNATVFLEKMYLKEVNE
jgi:hypothetical protein